MRLVEGSVLVVMVAVVGPPLCPPPPQKKGLFLWGGSLTLTGGNECVFLTETSNTISCVQW